MALDSPDTRHAITGLARRYQWRLVVLFGSIAREGKGRDMDLAVQPLSMPDLFMQGRWLRELEELFPEQPVDLLVLSADTAPLTRFEVFRDGICLYESEPGLFDREQDRAFFLHADNVVFQRAHSEAGNER